MSSTHAPFDDAKYRQVLGHFPTGVSVITAVHEGSPVGLAVGSFASLSLDPALVLFCPGNQSSSWPKIREAGSFCVNILGADQEHVCRVFASKEPDKFAAIGWQASPITGAPRIDGVLAWIDCDIEEVHPGGDHDIVVGRVRDLDAKDDHGPLVFYRGGYGRFEVEQVPIYALGEHVPRIDPTAFIHPEAVLIGRVTIGAESTVWPGAVLRGDGAGISVGARTSVQDGAILHNTEVLRTVVGDDCTIGHLAHLEGCTVEDGALVGTASVVLHEAIVGRGALVGANAVVTGRTVVPAGAMALGVPAKIRDGAADPEQNLRDAQHYVERGRRYRRDLRRIDN